MSTGLRPTGMLTTSFKETADKNFCLIQGINLCSLLLHPDMYFLPLSSRAAIA